MGQQKKNNNFWKSKLKSANHRVMFDRIEAGTFIIAGALTGSKLLQQALIVKF